MPGTPPTCRHRPPRGASGGFGGLWCRGCPGSTPPRRLLVPVLPRPRPGGFGGSGAASEPERIPAARPDGSARSRPVATAVFWQKPPFSFTFPPAPRWILGEGEAPGPPPRPQNTAFSPQIWGFGCAIAGTSPMASASGFLPTGGGGGTPRCAPTKMNPVRFWGAPNPAGGGGVGSASPPAHALPLSPVSPER